MRSDRVFPVGVPDPENPWAMIGFDSIDTDTGDRQQGWRPPDDEEARAPGDLSDMVFAIDTVGSRIFVAPRDFPGNRLDLPDGTTYEGEHRLDGLGW